MEISLEGGITALAFAASLVVLLLGTRFVPRADFTAEMAKKDSLREKLSERITLLEKGAALAQQPMDQVQTTLRSIDDKMSEFLDLHRTLDHRLTHLEARSSVLHGQRHGTGQNPDDRPPSA